MFQQWEKGREKTTFPTVFNYDYNRNKFANLDKADQKAMPPPRIAQPVSSQDRKLRKRKSRSLERRRQPKNIELSDSDEELTIQAHPSTSTVAPPLQPPPPPPAPRGSAPAVPVENIDEVDHSTTPVPSITEVIANDIDCIEKAPETNDQPAISIADSSLDEQHRLHIEESSTSTSISGPESHCQNVIVDVHETDVVLEIREGTDDGPLRGSSFRTKLTKDSDLEDVPESEAENEWLDEDQSPTPTPPVDNNVQSEPLVLVPKCDINENVVGFNDTHPDDCSMAEVDINHNDVVHTTIEPIKNECKIISSENNDEEAVVKRHDQRRISESSRSSFDESDGLDTEPTYARVESLKHRVSFCFIK